MSTATWARRGGFAIAGIMLLALAIGSLEQGSDESSRAFHAPVSRGETEPAASEELAGLRDAEGAGSAAFSKAGSDVGEGPRSTLAFGDRVIRTADVSVEVDERGFDAAWRAVFSIAPRLGGTVLTSSRGAPGPVPGDGARASDDPLFGDITIRVPADRFEAALNELRALGTVRADSTSADDVTEEFVDLGSRLRHLKAQESVMLRLTRRAKTIDDTITVQAQLSDIQAQIEQITGRLSFLEARTEFSTITMHLAEPGAVPGRNQGPSFARAWDTAVVGLERMGTAGLIIAVWAAPFALLYGISVRVRRTRRPLPQP